jgi:hypothetical protein
MERNKKPVPFSLWIGLLLPGCGEEALQEKETQLPKETAEETQAESIPEDATQDSGTPGCVEQDSGAPNEEAQDSGTPNDAHQDSGTQEHDTEETEYSIEDRWVYHDFQNTMYEFTGSVRRTYYCEFQDVTDCDEAYWSSLDTSDAIPGENGYTFDGEKLVIDLHFGNVFETTVDFECDGDKLTFSSNQSTLLRLGGDLENCPI